LTILSPELSGKRLELLKEAFPRLSHVAVLLDPRQPPLSFKETQTAGKSLGVKLQFLEVQDAADVESVFSAMRRARADALITLPHPFLQVHQRQILELAAKSRVPAMYQAADWVERGGLMSYGPDHLDNYRRAAVFVDKILKGTKPAEIPVEQPTKFEFIINLKTAKQIGVTIPPNVLARALFFDGIHFLISGTALRAKIVGLIGERLFQGLFSLMSLIGIVWLSRAYGQAEYLQLWAEPRTLGPFALIMMLFAFFFVVLAFTAPNPTAVGGGALLAEQEPAQVIQRITRHPSLGRRFLVVYSSRTQW
jgi:hypothetical protein